MKTILKSLLLLAATAFSTASFALVQEEVIPYYGTPGGALAGAGYGTGGSTGIYSAGTYGGDPSGGVEVICSRVFCSEWRLMNSIYTQQYFGGMWSSDFFGITGLLTDEELAAKAKASCISGCTNKKTKADQNCTLKAAQMSAALAVEDVGVTIIGGIVGMRAGPVGAAGGAVVGYNVGKASSEKLLSAFTQSCAVAAILDLNKCKSGNCNGY